MLVIGGQRGAHFKREGKATPQGSGFFLREKFADFHGYTHKMPQVDASDNTR